MTARPVVDAHSHFTPHAVITRAVVVPESVTLVITMVRGRAFAAADGSIEVALREGTRVTVKRFRDGFFPYQGSQIKQAFERLKK